MPTGTTATVHRPTLIASGNCTQRRAVSRIVSQLHFAFVRKNEGELH